VAKAQDESPAPESSPLDESKSVANEETSAEPLAEEVTTLKTPNAEISSKTKATVNSEMGKLIFKL